MMNIRRMLATIERLTKGRLTQLWLVMSLSIIYRLIGSLYIEMKEQ